VYRNIYQYFLDSNIINAGKLHSAAGGKRDSSSFICRQVKQLISPFHPADYDVIENCIHEQAYKSITNFTYPATGCIGGLKRV
jgi:hypothetical protein